MSASASLAALNIETKPRSGVRIEPALGLVVGLGGGALQSFALGTPITHGLAIGGAFGLVFGILFARRATSAGAGLIWDWPPRSSCGWSSPPDCSRSSPQAPTRWRLWVTHATSFPCWSATWFAWECPSAWCWAFAAA